MKVHVLPILKENYVFILENAGGAVVVDPGDGKAVIDFLWKQGLTLMGILITHHHWDHVDGVADLLKHEPVPVWIPAADKDRWPWGQNLVREGDEFPIAGFHFSVVELPGHTLDHVAYYERAHGWLFSGDVLFGLGCGRLFEGTPEQMYRSLMKIKALPTETAIYCTHEYTKTNLAFTEGLDLDLPALPEYRGRIRAAREAGHPTVPLSLADEAACNPFLTAPNATVFAERRELRNHFQTKSQT
jgi:hydroxyacylglutathione hydrolase